MNKEINYTFWGKDIKTNWYDWYLEVQKLFVHGFAFFFFGRAAGVDDRNLIGFHRLAIVGDQDELPVLLDDGDLLFLLPFETLAMEAKA